MKYKGIDFEVDGIYTWKAQALFDALPIPSTLPLFQVDVEADGDVATMYLYIQGDNPHEYSERTEEFLDTLKARGFDAMPSDEDYGETDMVIIDFDLDGWDERLKAYLRLCELKHMRAFFYSQRCTPRPKSSPYDARIKELEQLLGVSQ